MERFLTTLLNCTSLIEQWKKGKHISHMELNLTTHFRMTARIYEEIALGK